MSDDIKSRVHVRRARPEDYRAVISTHDFVYDGGDYLPVMYHVYLHRKEADCYVLELDGKIVSVQGGLETTTESCTMCIYIARRRTVMCWSWMRRL